MTTFYYKVGFIGVGNLAQAIIKSLLDSKTINPQQIFASNRSPGKLHKVVEQWKVQGLPNNEEVIEAADIIILAMKPQDFPATTDPLISVVRPGQIIISLAAGIKMETLEKKFPDCRIVRLMPNTPSVIQKGVIGYLLNQEDLGLNSTVVDLFSCLGYTIKVKDEDQLETLIVASASGVGFVYEFMMYFQDWIEEHDFDSDTAKKMVINTFLGAALLAQNNKDQKIEELQTKVLSKKGVTLAGLESMRELEIERALRISFEKAALRNQELAKL